MKMKFSLTVIMTLLVSQLLLAQELYVPRNVAKAFEKGTRSRDGNPGKSYWQNKAHYTIAVEARPPQRKITGTEDIVYINNSPDTLRSLTYKLIMNIHKAGVIREAPAADDYLTSGLHIDSYRENSVAKEWRDPGPSTVNRMMLTKPLVPHDSVKINIGWHFDMSVESGREGAIDSTTFFLAYFYPRIAVYDDYNGWDRNNHTDAQEFYNDFNDYDFELTVPKNYLVWSTGDLLNAAEVLQPASLKLYNESLTSDSILHIATAADLKSKSITLQKDNVWKWKASNVSDITMAISNHYVWDAGSVVVDLSTQRRASVQAGFNDRSADFHQMVKFAKHSLDWFSNNLPGVPYPFQKTSVIEGFADMEYPMMVNDSHQDNAQFARFVVEHEIAHTWFPFYMGINENRYGFMDEGWATFFELMIGRVDLGKENAEKLFKQFRVTGWIGSPSMEQDLPIITPSSVLSGVAMGNNEYGKPALGYLALQDLLGEAAFKKSLHVFMDRWHGKHPLPWDMFNSFNSASGQNLNWFWNSWFFSNGYIDYTLQKVEVKKKETSISIRNVGGYPAPFDLVISYDDKPVEKRHISPATWHAGAVDGVFTLKVPAAKSVKIDGGVFLDATPSDNTWERK